MSSAWGAVEATAPMAARRASRVACGVSGADWIASRRRRSPKRVQAGFWASVTPSV